MDSPIYYSSAAKNLYRLKEGSTIKSNNQNFFVCDQFGEFMLMAQKQHEQILEQLDCMRKSVQQNSMQTQFQQGHINTNIDLLSNGFHSFKKTVVNELQNLNVKVDTLSDSQDAITLQRNLLMNTQQTLQEMRTLPNQVKQAQDRLLANQNEMQNNLNEQLSNLTDGLLSEHGELRSGIKNLGSDLLNELNNQSEGRYTRLLDTINQLKELLDNQDPYTLFNFGDRITILDRSGNVHSGIFIESTENEVIWVNDTTMNLSVTNIKGLTISKG